MIFYCLIASIREGELVLMDAGSEYHGYASDVTRTWPVGGKFSDPQRELYEVVLRVQKKCLKVSGDALFNYQGNPFGEITSRVATLLSFVGFQ